MYHISDIKRFLRCERLYCYSLNEENVYNAYLRNDESINDLLQQYFSMEKCFSGTRNDPMDVFIKEEENYEWFQRARLEYQGIRFNIPVMHKAGDAYDLYFLYPNTSIREVDLTTYRISCQCFKKLGRKIASVSLIYLNKDYVFHKELDVHELFSCTNIIKGKDLKELIEEEEVDFETVLRKMRTAELEKYPPRRKRSCRLRERCRHYYDCFPKEKAVEEFMFLPFEVKE